MNKEPRLLLLPLTPPVVVFCGEFTLVALLGAVPAVVDLVVDSDIVLNTDCWIQMSS
jgi:hypothetical protein